MSDVFPDWSKAVGLAEVAVKRWEAIGPIDQAYAMGHRDGPVTAGPGAYLVRDVDDHDHVFALESLDGYVTIPKDEAPDAPLELTLTEANSEDRPGHVRIIGEPVVLEGDDAAAFIAAFAAAGASVPDEVSAEVSTADESAEEAAADSPQEDSPISGAAAPPAGDEIPVASSTVDGDGQGGEPASVVEADAPAPPDVEIGGPAADVEAIDPAAGIEDIAAGVPAPTQPEETP